MKRWILTVTALFALSAVAAIVAISRFELGARQEPSHSDNVLATRAKHYFIRRSSRVGVPPPPQNLQASIEEGDKLLVVHAQMVASGAVRRMPIAAARIGITAYEYRRAQAAAAEAERRLQSAAPEASEARFRPSEAVRQLLDRTDAATPRLDGEYPCVSASIEDSKPHAQLGKCALPTDHSGQVDRFEADLRCGSFMLRQSDLYVKDVFEVPLTRTYNSNDDSPGAAFSPAN